MYVCRSKTVGKCQVSNDAEEISRCGCMEEYQHYLSQHSAQRGSLHDLRKVTPVKRSDLEVGSTEYIQQVLYCRYRLSVYYKYGVGTVCCNDRISHNQSIEKTTYSTVTSSSSSSPPVPRTCHPFIRKSARKKERRRRRRNMIRRDKRQDRQIDSRGLWRCSSWTR
jgi:hypothetical protein